MKLQNKNPKQADINHKEYDQGVVIGVLVGIDKNKRPIVVFPSNPEESGILAKSTTVFNKDDVGCEVALLFENANKRSPLIIGRIQQPKTEIQTEVSEPVDIKLDDEHLTFSAKQSITLKCGKASITLTKAGKVIIRGDYVLSRSSGVNRVKGGSVQIN